MSDQPKPGRVVGLISGLAAGPEESLQPFVPERLDRAPTV